MLRHVLALIRAVPLREWPALAVAVVVAAGVEVGLHTVELPTLARFLGTPLADDGNPPTRTGRHVPIPPRLALRMRAVSRIMRHWPLGDTCLRRALVCGQRIRRLHPELRIGVAKTHERIRAHAWLEVRGVTFDPEAANEFAVLQRVAR